ncbi:unnamed protein product [Rotaria sordida]|uniref:G-protein coupled receptors family 1 profile domain-containing protein n=1 Tax=Rotaria sordida TaxID=392033 RepID=A0A819NI66_9BILA|nr:unnamed protein product [Rotaria sordida]
MMSADDNSTQLPALFETYFTRNIKFGLSIALEPPALICNFILLYYLIVNPTLRRSLHHHSILALLVVNLLTNICDTPRAIHFLHVGMIMPQTKVNCIIWQWYDYTFYAQVNVLLSWTSIERYILIFHGNVFNTAKRRLYFHYLPLAAIIVYLILFYIIVIFFIPCNQFDFNAILCGLPCYASQLIISLYDNFAHNWLPLGINILLSISLVIRVFYRNRAGLQQHAQRKKHLRMVLQLLVISSLHIASALPYSLVVFIQVVAGLPEFAAYVQNSSNTIEVESKD